MNNTIRSTTGRAHNRNVRLWRDTFYGVTQPSIRCLARRGGVMRISGLIVEQSRDVLDEYIGNGICLIAFYFSTIISDQIYRACKSYDSAYQGYTLRTQETRNTSLGI